MTETNHIARFPLCGVTLLAGIGASLATSSLSAEDWPQWGRDASKNMVSSETGLVSDFYPGDYVGNTDEIDVSTAKNVAWIAKLGSQTYGNPTVANGNIYVGTNNDSPRDPRFKGDRSCVYCFDEKTGAFKWQYNMPKLGTGKVSDWEYLGICSSPTVEGNFVYLVNNHCEVMCLDVNGMADGNDGYQGEGQMMAEKGQPAVEVTATDADVIWRMNMIDECGVFPHNITCSAVLVAGDNLWVSTSNGVDYGHVETPAPFAPSLILVDKKTGKLKAEESSGLSQRIFHCNWSSPAFLDHDGTRLGIFGGPDGWVYGFTEEPSKDEDGYDILTEKWRFDANLPEYRIRRGMTVKYATRGGPSEVIATPVTYDGRVYVAIGQDPEHGEGVGNLVCIDPSGDGDVTKTKQVWNFPGINRSLSTVAIVDGLLYTADFSGFVYCLDVTDGSLVWKYDTMAHIWGSPLVADGKVYIGNEDGYLTILKAGRETEKPGEADVIGEVDVMAPVYSSPIAANGRVYLATHTHLFALEQK